MKAFKSLLVALAMLIGAQSVMAQQQTFGEEWGENATQEERYQNALKFNFYKDAYDNKKYDVALGYLKDLLRDCPKAKMNIYVWGTNIYRRMIAGATSVNERNLYTDSLMMLYDMRAEHFADDARYGLSYILKGKAKDYYNYRASDKPGVLKVFQDAIAASESVDAEFTAQYFQVLTEQYQDLEIETEYYMDEYDRVAKLMATTGDQKYIDTFENLFINSGAANCENLEKIYKPRFEGGNADVAQVKKAFALLSRSECLTPFFFEVGDMLLAQEATAETAMALAKGYEKNGDLTKSIEYLTKAIEAEQDPITKSQLAIQIAGNEILNDNPRNAANFAKQAIEINPESAMAYIVLAQAYAAGSGACSDFERLTVYWLAYDTLMNARRLLEEGDPQLQTVEQLAQSFRNSFPNKEECFFRGLSAGNAYTVNCGWISGRTTVKEGR